MRNARINKSAVPWISAAVMFYAVGFQGIGLAQDETGNLSLVCPGSGTKTENQTTYVNQYNRKTDEREFATANTTVRRPFNGTIYIDIYGPLGRIKLPKAMLPIIKSDNEGWFDINGLSISDRAIAGKIRINALNKPKLQIDRNTGSIDLSSGFGSFSGQCELWDKSASGRRF